MMISWQLLASFSDTFLSLASELTWLTSSFFTATGSHLGTSNVSFCRGSEIRLDTLTVCKRTCAATPDTPGTPGTTVLKGPLGQSAGRGASRNQGALPFSAAEAVSSRRRHRIERRKHPKPFDICDPGSEPGRDLMNGNRNYRYVIL